MALELNDDTKINVELQIRMQKHWIKRQLFYLARMYDEDLKLGQDYRKLQKCISIGILDFKLLEGEGCHSIGYGIPVYTANSTISTGPYCLPLLRR